jgi:hypothetical protein
MSSKPMIEYHGHRLARRSPGRGGHAADGVSHGGSKIELIAS